MKKWFQVYIDDKESEASIPMRIDPDQIYGIKKYGESQTILFTKIGAFTVSEEYNHLSTRLFAFANYDSDETDCTLPQKPISPVQVKKKVLIKRKPLFIEPAAEADSYYDMFQPETNS